jgi:preprotein translocase subunit SecB
MNNQENNEEIDFANLELDEAKLPKVTIESQYLKDFSFENPRAPKSLLYPSTDINVDMSLNVDINKTETDDIYEVTLQIEIKAKHKDNSDIFMIDLKYGGCFKLFNFEEQQVHFVLAVHAPSLIFPYARKIISDATQNGGFQPLFMDPVDFGLMFQKRVIEEMKKQQESK